MIRPLLRPWIAAVSLAVGLIPACGDDEDDGSAFAGGAGRDGSGGAQSGKGGSSTNAGSGGDETSDGGEPSSGGDGSGGDGNASSGGAPASGGANAGGSGGDPSGQGGAAPEPWDGWYCIQDGSGCLCTEQQSFQDGEENCIGHDCCYVYDGGAALACTCTDDDLGSACDAVIDNDEGTPVDHCPP
jgi:hypothetical protein